MSRKRNESHGHTSRRGMTPEYRAWKHMRERCENQNSPRYRDYGGRGVTVCERWRQSFGAFLDDLGPRPSSEHSLDRYPNNDGNYEPENCRWATRTEQAANRRPSLRAARLRERISSAVASGIPVDRTALATEFGLKPSTVRWHESDLRSKSRAA